MSQDLHHEPVMAAEVLAILEPAAGKVLVDATLGGGGHARLLAGTGARVIGIDQDPYALERVRAEGNAAITVVEGNFRAMRALVASVLGEGARVDGVLMDLGVSSFQLDAGERGFSFHEDAPLDMRMSQSGPSAADLVNELDTEELAAILYEYGEERHSRRIARAIEREREREPITTTKRLAEVIRRAYPNQHARGIHPARRSFQALRIKVNDELGALRDGLQAAAAVTAPGGRLAVISFHSLEDRIVKRALRDGSDWTPLSKKPVEASEAELARNPRARSAKLRGASRNPLGAAA